VAREIYFKDAKFSDYSLWHRGLNSKIAKIDIDSCGICVNCWEPLYLAETVFDIGQTYKTTHTTERLALRSDLPSFLIFYKVVNQEVVKFRIKRLTPAKSHDFYELDPKEWEHILIAMQKEHNQICTKYK
tara:strand:+ start:86 stop:475 length:390 start_codon:yes stop_codon:yes gene_type:complete